jgi:hypothetical protein
MQDTRSSAIGDWAARALDELAPLRTVDTALQQVDRLRREIAGDSIFSIQQNVTTGADPANQIQLRRFFSSEGDHFPVLGNKRKTLTPWVDCLFLRGRVFVGEGADLLARTFDDFDQMQVFGVQSVINVPLMQGNLCFATFNVFGTRTQWRADEKLGIQLLALAAARWVPRAPGLAYAFEGVSDIASVES